MLRRNKLIFTFAIIAVVLIAIRVAAPYIVKDYVNRGLHQLQAYDGSIQDIDIALWRGAYRIDGIRIEKRGVKHETPFFSCERVDLSVQWRSLLHGSLVSEVLFVRPVVNLVQAETKQESQTGTEENWQARLEQLSPFRFNTIEARDATVTFRAPGIKTQDAIKAQHVHAVVTNLTNVADANKETFADFHVDGFVLGTAPMKINGSLDPWAKQPTFDVNLEVKQVALPKVNPWLRQYIKAGAASGDFELYMEIAAAEGKFKGYAKPIMQNVKMASSEDKGVLRKLWESIIDVAAKVLENKQENQVAARVPLSGSIAHPEAGIWATITSVLSNAFVGAFAHSLEGSISLRDVEQNLGRYTQDQDKEKGKDNERNAKEKADRSERQRAGPRGST